MRFSILTQFAMAITFCLLASCALFIENESLCHEKIKYAEYFAEEHDLNCYFDYDQALYCARTLKKPLLVIVGGWHHLSFSRMNESTLSTPKLKHYLDEHFVTVILYIDERRELAESEKYIIDNRYVVKTIGNRNNDILGSKFQIGDWNGIFVLDTTEKMITERRYYRGELNDFIKWLEINKHKFDNPTPISQ